MSHGYCGYGRRFDQSYKEKFKSAWHNWETPAANYLKKDLNTVFIYQDSQLLDPVVCFAELVYGPFGHLILGLCPNQPGSN